MDTVALAGGTEQDRETLLALHANYLDANTRFDWEQVRAVFSDSAAAEFFNMNGFTYRGLPHWTRLWQYYATQVQSTDWTPYQVGGVIGDRTATLWCHRRCRRRWVGADRPVKDVHYDDSEFMSRSTMVFLKEAAGWRVIHAHFSKGEEGPRPGGV